MNILHMGTLVVQSACPLSDHMSSLLKDIALVGVPDTNGNASQLAIGASGLHVIVGTVPEDIRDQAGALVHEGRPHISVRLSQGGAEIGPTWIRPGTACFHCAEARLLANESIPSPPDPESSWEIQDAWWETVLCREVAALRIGSLPVLTIDHLLDCDGMQGRVTRRRILRAPRCPLCRGCEDGPLLSPWQVGSA